MGAGVLGFDPALLRSIGERVGTPTYVYSANLIRAQYHALDDALHGIRHRICYSVKANGNLGVLRVLKQLGAGADIVSVGELRRARIAGFDPDGVVFSGVGKTAGEIEEAICAGVGFIGYCAYTLPLSRPLGSETPPPAMLYATSAGQPLAARGVYRGEKLTADHLPPDLVHAVVQQSWQHRRGAIDR